MTRTALLAGSIALVMSATGEPRPLLPSLTVIRVAIEGDDGTPLTGVAASELALLVDGKLVEIESFGVKRDPVTMVVLVDLSSSMLAAVGGPGKSLALAGIGLRSLEGALRSIGAPDRLRVGGFSGQTIVGSSFSSDPRVLVEDLRTAFAMLEADRYGPSPVWDAIHGAVEMLERESGLRTVVVETDGRATGNRLGLADVILKAQLSGVSINVIGEGRTVTHAQDEEYGVRIAPDLPLRRLTNESGGIYVADGPARAGVQQYMNGVVQPAVPGRILTEMIRRLHNTYSLSFSAPVRDGRIHALEVRARRGAKVRAPARFLAPPT